MSKLNESPVRIKSFQFACEIVTYCRKLKKNKEFEIASQLIRSATSIGANVREAQRGQSKRDFKYKLGIALKEADETKYWLEIIEKVIEPIPNDLMNKCEELIKILVSIIKNTDDS